jgi:polysaccharide export outer membrane protein
MPAAPAPTVATNPAVATTATAILPTGNYPGTAEYRIGSQDLLDIQVFGVNEMSRTVRVNSRGMISLPLIGPVQAAGLTAEDLQARLAAALAKDYLQNPQVSIFIKEYTSQRVTVEGAVNKPGIFPLQGQTTLMQALALAQGVDKLADTSNIRLFRGLSSAGDRTAAQFSLDAIRAGRAVDPLIQGDDVIVVETNMTRAVLKDVTDTVRGFIVPFAIFQ